MSDSDYKKIQDIGEMIRGPIIKSLVVLLDELKKVKSNKLKKSAAEVIDELIDETSEVGAILENFDAYN